MPIKTQIRLQQLTGTLDDTVASSGAINESSLQGVMNHLASSIQRIHGTTGFAASEAGHFHQALHISASLIDFSQAATVQTDAGNLTIKAANGAADIRLDSGNGEFFLQDSGNTKSKISHAANDLSFRNMTDNQDIIFSTTNSGAEREVFRLDGSADSNAGAILVATDKKIHFRDDALTIHSSVNGQLDIDADTEIELTAPTIDINASSEVNISNNLTVGGNLTVDGTTTTLNTANLTVEDPFLLLGDSAQVANSNSGIIFVSGSSAGASRPDVSFARVANDTWALGSIASNSGSITNATGATIDVNMRAKSFEIVDGNNAIKDTSNELHIDSDNKIRLDVGATHVISLRENGTEKGIIDFNNNTLIMSSTLGALELMSATGGLLFKDTHDGSNNPRGLAELRYGAQEQSALFQFDAAQGGILSSKGGNELALGFSGGGYLALGIEDTNSNFMGSSIMAFSGSTTSNDQVDAILLLGKDASPGSGFEPDPAFLDKATLTISGSALVLDNGASNSEAQLKFKASTSANFVTLAAPATVGSTLNLVLPATDGSNGHVLQTDGSGNLSFVAQGGASAAIKKVATVTKTAGFNANTAVAFSTGADFEGTPGALNVSSVDAANRVNAIDVYVNGQLLVSGTSAPADDVTGGDYVLIDVDAGGGFAAAQNDADLKFAFGIEADDVISVIVRA